MCGYIEVDFKIICISNISVIAKTSEPELTESFAA